MIKINNKFKIRFLAIFSIMLLCVSTTFRELQNDTFYIIKLGEDILKNGVDLIDHYCWIADLSYTYPHWLYDLLIYLIYSKFSFLGVYVSTVVLFVILILSIYFINLRFNKNEFMAFFISIISVACLYVFATARAQLVTAILFLWQVYFIEKLIEVGKKRYIFYLVLISWLVANLHATIWLFCFILYLPFLGEHLICIFANSKLGKKKFHTILKNDKIIIDKVTNFKKIFFSFILSFLVGLLTPSKICYSYIFRVMQGSSQSYITEHAPMVVIQHPCFMVFVLLILLILIFSKTKIKLKELFMICGLLLMSLVSIRHVAFFYIIGVIYISILSNRYLLEKGDRTLDILTRLIVRNKIIYLFIIVIVVFFSCSKFQKNMKQDFVNNKDYPVEAVDYIKNNLDVENLKLFNGYNYGSYLLFNDIPVFIDSRCDLYLKEFNGLDYSIFDDFVNIENIYEKKFKKYGVTHVLLYKKQIFSKILINDSNYNIIYEDKHFILFEVVVK